MSTKVATATQDLDMLRLRFSLPRPQPFYTQDLIHDALVKAFVAAGIPGTQVVGPAARAWTFAPLATHRPFDPKSRRRQRMLHELVVSTPDPDLAKALAGMDPGTIESASPANAERLSLAGARVRPELDPVVSGCRSLAAYWLSPLVVLAPPSVKGKRWMVDPLAIEKTDPGPVLSRRLGCALQLSWVADRLAARTTAAKVCQDIKIHPRTGQPIFVVGTKVPFVLTGDEQALRLAWYAGLGSKTRMGFGCWDPDPVAAMAGGKSE